MIFNYFSKFNNNGYVAKTQFLQSLNEHFVVLVHEIHTVVEISVSDKLLDNIFLKSKITSYVKMTSFVSWYLIFIARQRSNADACY